ncbi:MAG: hypothetical protein U0401_27300 [Anaerolineae bacterium]
MAQLLLANVSFMLLTVVVFRLGLCSSEAKWFIQLCHLRDIIRVLSNLEFWGLSGRLFDVRQGKRLFGLTGPASRSPLAGNIDPGWYPAGHCQSFIFSHCRFVGHAGIAGFYDSYLCLLAGSPA